MPMATEDSRVGTPIKMTNEPVGPKSGASKGGVGDVALMDAVAIVVVCWIIVLLLMFSLRRHNV